MITLFTQPGKPTALRDAIAVAKNLDLQYEVKDLASLKGPKSPWYYKKPPETFMIPAMVDHGNNDYVLWDMSLVVPYLSTRYYSASKQTALTKLKPHIEESPKIIRRSKFEITGSDYHLEKESYMTTRPPSSEKNQMEYPYSVAQITRWRGNSPPKNLDRFANLLEDTPFINNYFPTDKANIFGVAYMHNDDSPNEPWTKATFQILEDAKGLPWNKK